LEQALGFSFTLGANFFRVGFNEINHARIANPGLAREVRLGYALGVGRKDLDDPSSDFLSAHSVPRFGFGLRFSVAQGDSQDLTGSFDVTLNPFQFFAERFFSGN
jgi:hypothetical protein